MIAFGRIHNRVTEEQIPEDEPVFILRARDTVQLSATLIHYYEGRLSNQNIQHADAVLARVRDFQRFMNEHPERMNYPDTAVSPD